jgi:hypothetical protein
MPFKPFMFRSPRCAAEINLSASHIKIAESFEFGESTLKEQSIRGLCRPFLAEAGRNRDGPRFTNVEGWI